MYQPICPLSITCVTNNTEIWTNLLYWSRALSILTTWNVEVFVSLVRSRLEALLLPKFENIDKKLSRCMYKKQSQSTLKSPKVPLCSLVFFAIARNFKENVFVRGGNGCDRCATAWHDLPQSASLAECAPRRRASLITRAGSRSPRRAPPPAAKPPPAPHLQLYRKTLCAFVEYYNMLFIALSTSFLKLGIMVGMHALCITRTHKVRKHLR